MYVQSFQARIHACNIPQAFRPDKRVNRPESLLSGVDARLQFQQGDVFSVEFDGQLSVVP